MEIRNETQSDYRQVEELTREAFWNLYVPGCDEHYYLHHLRAADCFLPSLDLVATDSGQIVGHIAYIQSQIVQDNGNVFDTITFGPVSILPAHQNKGIGSMLISHSMKLASQQGHKAVIIFGYPDYYSRFGFEAAKHFGISDETGKYPYAMQVLELQNNALKGISGKFHMKFNYVPTPELIDAFDQTFTPKDKFETASQKQFAEALAKYL